MSAEQAVLRVGELPDAPLDAAEVFFGGYLAQARQLLGEGAASLVIALPDAPQDHDDWRRALARDLARAYAPQRVNVVAEGRSGSANEILEFLGYAPGVTGQYIPAHV